MSISLLSIRISLSTRMGGPWGDDDAGELPADATVDAESLLCHVLGAVVHGWEVLRSRYLRVSFAMHLVRTSKCKFFFFRANGHLNRTSKPPIPGPQRVYSSTCDVCNMYVSTYLLLTVVFLNVGLSGGGGGQRGKKNKKGGTFLLQKAREKA